MPAFILSPTLSLIVPRTPAKKDLQLHSAAMATARHLLLPLLMRIPLKNPVLKKLTRVRRLLPRRPLVIVRSRGLPIPVAVVT